MAWLTTSTVAQNFKKNERRYSLNALRLRLRIGNDATEGRHEVSKQVLFLGSSLQ